MIERYSKSNIPGFTAQNLFTYKYESSSSLRDHYSDLSRFVTPQDCFSSCIIDCPSGGPARKGCLTECFIGCNCNKKLGCGLCSVHCANVPYGSARACMNTFCPGCCWQNVRHYTKDDRDSKGSILFQVIFPSPFSYHGTKILIISFCTWFLKMEVQQVLHHWRLLTLDMLSTKGNVCDNVFEDPFNWLPLQLTVIMLWPFWWRYNYFISIKCSIP
jgi:hypothetical protein